MTALSEYERLEASGLWRASKDAQRSEVIVSIGDATLIISDLRDQALAHWSLPAVVRANPGERPAIYHPDGDPDETLEFSPDDAQMIDAIEKLRSAIERRRPHPGRLRLVVLSLITLTILGLAIFWLPGQLRRHALAVVPDVKRAEIGAALLKNMRSVTGPPCRSGGGQTALDRLAARIPSPYSADRLIVVRDGVQGTVSLPGGTILLNRSLVEDFEEPDIAAGYVIAERMRARKSDALDRLLAFGGPGASIRLLTTGELGDGTLSSYAEHLLSTPPGPIDNQTLLDGFRNWSVRSTPYAYARDISGESTLALIEADPFSGRSPEPVLSDGDWVRLQGICGG